MLAELNERLGELQAKLAACAEHKVLVVFQAMDTGGKDGTIRNVFRGVNPQGVRVTSFKAPNDERARARLPLAHPPQRAASTARSASSTAATTRTCSSSRVHDLVPKAQWRKRYDHIVDVRAACSPTRAPRSSSSSCTSRRTSSASACRRGSTTRTKHWKFNPARPRRAQALGRLPGGVRRRAQPHEHRRRAVVDRARRTASGTATSSCPRSSSTRSMR